MAVYRPYIAPLSWVLESVEENSAVVDIGCGTGALSSLMLRRSNVRHVTGIDPAQGAVTMAEPLLRSSCAKGQAFTLVETGEPSAIEELLGRADAVVLCDVLHHIPFAAQEGYLAALAQAMRPGARLIIKDIDASSWLVWANRLHDRVVTGSRGEERTPDEVVLMCTRYGLSLLSSRTQRVAWYPHFMRIFVKA